jgi:hypothetical protein
VCCRTDFGNQRNEGYVRLINVILVNKYFKNFTFPQDVFDVEYVKLQCEHPR